MSQDICHSGIFDKEQFSRWWLYPSDSCVHVLEHSLTSLLNTLISIGRSFIFLIAINIFSEPMQSIESIYSSACHYLLLRFRISFDIFAGHCLFLSKQRSELDYYECGSFSFGCPDRPYLGSSVYKCENLKNRFVWFIALDHKCTA